MSPRQPDRRRQDPAYAVEQKPRGWRPGPCVACGGAVEPWAAPLDPRVPPLCDKCAREHSYPRLPPPLPQKLAPDDDEE